VTANIERVDMIETVPDVISRYLRAADEKDPEGLAACFTADGTVVDEGIVYRGHDEIVSWRESTLGKWEYMSTVTRTESVSAQEQLAFVHVEGNFPSGQADLTYRFRLEDGMVAALSIVE
jgi:uncharacterized protein (TIGR02246 family)